MSIRNNILKLRDIIVSNTSGQMDIIWGPDMKSVQTAIITGINGQDGSYLAEFLLEKGYNVIGIIRRSSTDNTERIKNILGHERFILMEGDITDSSNVNSWIREFKPDEFYNLAAQSHVGTSFKQPQLTWRVDAEGVINILEAIRHINPSTRFYQASTSEMFGRNFSIGSNDPGPGISGHFETFKYQDENTPFAPQSPYGVAKVAAHQSVQMYREAYNLHASCGILFNHESERRGEQFVTRKITKWIGRYFNWYSNLTAWESEKPSFDNNYIFLHNEKFPKLRLGNLDAYRDWGHAKDYVVAMWMMLQQDEPDDYVICTEESYSVNEFLNEAFSVVGIDNYKDFIVQDPEFMRPAEVDYLKGMSSKARSKLGWKPNISFKDLVKQMVKNDCK